jgi:peptide deformylase
LEEQKPPETTKDPETIKDPGITVVTDISYLRQVSKKTSMREVEKRELVTLVKYGIHKAWVFGYGLAAIQLGMPIAAAWYWLPEDEEKPLLAKGHLLINPVILEKKELIIKANEGCLSIPNKFVTTKRYNWIRYETDGEIKVATGIEAQIVQHETDHMNGILVIDREYKPNLTGRNDPCPCGSGKKYKKCCLDKPEDELEEKKKGGLKGLLFR